MANVKVTVICMHFNSVQASIPEQPFADQRRWPIALDKHICATCDLLSYGLTRFVNLHSYLCQFKTLAWRWNARAQEFAEMSST